VRSAQIDGISVREGEIMGLVNGTLKAKGSTLSEVTKESLEQIEAEEYEIVTIYYGESVTADIAQQLAGELEAKYPEQEIEVVDGGQPHYYYIVSAE
jgi:dihydroxyacetone kinase-like predicted kinase